MSKNLIKDPLVGGKCYYDFKLCTIKEVEHGLIRAVSDGFGTTSGNIHLWCRPVSAGAKACSEMLTKDKEVIYGHPVGPRNIPAIHHKMVEYWIRMVDGKDNTKYQQFITKLIKKLDDVGKFKLEGIKVFVNR